MNPVQNSCINNFQIIDTPQYLRYELSQDDLELEVYFNKSMRNFMLAGGAIGGVVGGAVGGVICIPTGGLSVVSGVLIGVAAGGAAGVAVGGGCRSYVVYTSREKEFKNVREGNNQVQQKIVTLAEAITEHSNILDIFLSDETVISKNARTEITDPISHGLMSRPVKGNCSHIFDYSEILNWIAIKKNEGELPECPMCRAPISQEEFKYSYKTALKTIEFIKKMEDVAMGSTMKLSDTDNRKAMRAIRDLRKSINSMTDKIFNNSVKIAQNHSEFKHSEFNQIHNSLIDWKETNTLA